MLRWSGDGPAVDHDPRAFVHAHAHRADDAAVHLDVAFGDKPLGRAARRDAAFGQQLLQPDRPGRLGYGVASWSTRPSGVMTRGSSSRLASPKHSRNSHVVP